MNKLLLLICLLAPFALTAQKKNNAKKLQPQAVTQPKKVDVSFFNKEMFITEDILLPYRIMFPENYDANKKYPVVLFLHGAGERGDDNEKQLTHGGDFFRKYNRKMFPAIVIAPQCPEGIFWANVSRDNGFTFVDSVELTKPMQAVVKLLNQMHERGQIDERRIYVGGLSMGGMGTFELLAKMPDKFAAAFPICGGGIPEKAKSYARNTGVWIFHGSADNVVPAAFSVKMYNVLKDADADVIYTEYPGVLHNSWDNAFAETALMPWLFGHRKCN